MDASRLIDDLVRDERLELHMYLDSRGIPTIGIGRNLRRGISKEEAYHLCHNDIDAVVTDLNSALPWWSNLDEVRQRVLANMCFNMGIARLGGFRKMLGYLHVGDFQNAAKEMKDSDWAKEVGVRADRLEQMVLTGQP